MTKFQSLNQYQKIVLLILAAMTALFSILYLIAFSRKGFAYKDTILIPSQEEGSTVYSGKIEGQLARFTVSPDKTVLFQYGDKTYGPYTARERQEKHLPSKRRAIYPSGSKNAPDRQSPAPGQHFLS